MKGQLSGCSVPGEWVEWPRETRKLESVTTLCFVSHAGHASVWVHFRRYWLRVTPCRNGMCPKYNGTRLHFRVLRARVWLSLMSPATVCKHFRFSLPGCQMDGQIIWFKSARTMICQLSFFMNRISASTSGSTKELPGRKSLSVYPHTVWNRMSVCRFNVHSFYL